MTIRIAALPLLVFCLFPLRLPAQEAGASPGRPGAPAEAGFIPFPHEISYQGLLTTPSGAPAADGAYDLRFDLFGGPAGGIALWTEFQNSVPVAGGVFTVRLGSVAPFSDLFYQNLWLEVTATAGPGLGGAVTFLPRTELAASAYALAPWRISGTLIYYPWGQAAVGASSAETGARLTVKTGTRFAGHFTSDSLNSQVHVLHAEGTGVGTADVRAVYGLSVPSDFWGVGGEFIGGWIGGRGLVFPSGTNSYFGLSGYTHGGNGTNYGVHGQATAGAINLGVYGTAPDSAGDYAGYFSGRTRVISDAGNDAVMLPDDAVTAPEIADEPGIAAHSPYNTFVLPLGTTSAVDSVTILAPAGGYIVVEAGGAIVFNHVNGTISSVWLNLDVTPGIVPSSAGFQWGYVNADQSSGTYPFNIRSQRIYPSTGINQEFFLNAYRGGGGGDASIRYKWIRATFFPTSYGSVTAASPAAGAGSAAASAAATDGAPAADLIEVDLRTAELDALRARAEAESAERRLLEARIAQERRLKGGPEDR